MQQPKGIAVVLGVIFGLVIVGAVVGGILLFKNESKTQTPATNTNTALQLGCSVDSDCSSYCGVDPCYQPICGVSTIGEAGSCTCRSICGPIVTGGNTNASVNVNASTNANTNSTVSTAGWKTYANDEYSYMLRYPVDYTVTESSNGFHGGVTFRKNVTNDPARNVNGFIMPDSREVIVSVISASPMSRYAGNADYQKYYQWVRSDFKTELPSGYSDRETVKLGSNTFTRFTVASGVDNVYEYFLRKGDLTFSFYESVLTKSTSAAHAENQQLLATFTFTK